MIMHHRTRNVIGLIGIIVVTMACALPWAAPQDTKSTATATPDLSGTPQLPVGTATTTAGSAVGGSGTGGNSGSTGSGNGGTGGVGSGNTIGNEATATQLPDLFAGPYVVQQIETLGGEAISGVVCSLTQPFAVVSVTPNVTFTFNFFPLDAQHGNVTYAYSIPKAGESHDASGTYSLKPVDKGGTQQLSLSVSDHVVFKGFDGNIPNRYKFNLVPSASTPCRPTS